MLAHTGMRISVCERFPLQLHRRWGRVRIGPAAECGQAVGDPPPRKDPGALVRSTLWPVGRSSDSRSVSSLSVKVTDCPPGRTSPASSVSSAASLWQPVLDSFETEEIGSLVGITDSTSQYDRMTPRVDRPGSETKAGSGTPLGYAWRSSSLSRGNSIVGDVVHGSVVGRDSDLEDLVSDDGEPTVASSAAWSSPQAEGASASPLPEEEEAAPVPARSPGQLSRTGSGLVVFLRSKLSLGGTSPAAAAAAVDVAPFRNLPSCASDAADSLSDADGPPTVRSVPSSRRQSRLTGFNSDTLEYVPLRGRSGSNPSLRDTLGGGASNSSTASVDGIGSDDGGRKGGGDSSGTAGTYSGGEDAHTGASTSNSDPSQRGSLGKHRARSFSRRTSRNQPQRSATIRLGDPRILHQLEGTALCDLWAAVERRGSVQDLDPLWLLEFAAVVHGHVSDRYASLVRIALSSR